MNKIIKTILCILLSTCKALANTFVYLFSIVIVRALLFSSIKLSFSQELSILVLIILAIVFINDWINNFNMLYPPQQTKQGNNREGQRLGRPPGKVKDSDKPAETKTQRKETYSPKEKPDEEEQVAPAPLDGPPKTADTKAKVVVVPEGYLDLTGK